MSKIALLFSGQGSQYTSMGKEFYDTFEAASKVIEKFNAVATLDASFEALCFGENEKIHQTEYTQPLVLATCLSIFACLPEHIQKECAVAGLSLGEYSALIASEKLTFEEGVTLVCERAKYMSNVHDGAMLAVLKPDIEALQAYCQAYEERTGECLTISNYNSPKQVVCGGTAQAIEALEIHLSETRMRTTRLNVSGAFHTRLYDEANAKFQKQLQNIEWNKRNQKMYSCVTGEQLLDEEISSIMSRQMTSSMYFFQMIEHMIADGYTTFIEVGPSGILAKLVRGISKDVVVYTIERPSDLEKLENI